MDSKGSPFQNCDKEFEEQLSVSEIKTAYQKININVDRFFESLDNISIYKCPNTGYRFYYPFTIFGDDQFYQDLYANLPDYYNPKRWEYKFLIPKIPDKSKVLEIGCGSGVFLEKLNQKKCDTTGLELNSKAVADCKKKGLNVYGEFIQSFAEKNQEAFDIVCSFQVLEHVWEVESFITAALKALKPGGKLIISVPNSNPFFYKHDKYHTLNLPPHHSGLWDKQSLKNMELIFPVKALEIQAEPLFQYKDWYLAQAYHYKKTNPVIGSIMQKIPRPLYKFAVRIFSPFIEGSFLTAIYSKKE